MYFKCYNLQVFTMYSSPSLIRPPFLQMYNGLITGVTSCDGGLLWESFICCTAIRDHMVEFLVKQKFINTSQHGFLKARSCLTNLLCFWEEITKWVDDGLPVDVVYLDFQKAFDKVPHQRLLLKLKAHGIGNDVINWIEKWLTHTRQRVIVDGEISNWKSVLSGVPQEKDVGVTFSADMKVSEQCGIAASKGNQMLGLIRRTRFNKICHPSQRPRWQVDKEAIGLSRVQQCSSTYNPPS